MSGTGWVARTEAYIRENRLMERGDRLIVGVSGGADSVCLLEALCELAPDWQWELRVVHVHHGLRGESADEDERFVQALCRDKGVVCRSVRVDVPAEAGSRGIGSEECGRILQAVAADTAYAAGLIEELEQYLEDNEL